MSLIFGLFKDILDGGLEYKNQALHRGCFTCFKCRKRLVDKFVSKDEGPFCLDCFQRQSESFNCLKVISEIKFPKSIGPIQYFSNFSRRPREHVMD